MLRIGTLFYGGNFAVRGDGRSAHRAGCDTAIEFHGEDTNVGRRLFAVGPVVALHGVLALHLGTAVHHDGTLGRRAALRPQPSCPKCVMPPSVGYDPRRCEDVMPGYEPFLLCDFHVHTKWE